MTLLRFRTDAQSKRAHVLMQMIGVALIVLFSLTAFSFGQSGRRGSRSPAVSVPTPEPSPEERRPQKDERRIHLLVSANRGDVFAGIPLYLYDDVLQSCSRRLQESSAVTVELANKEMSRSDAIQQAHDANDGLVIWLNLRGEDQMGSYGGNLDAVFIEFFVWEAITAKVKAQGSSYQGNYPRGGVVLGPGTGSNNTVVQQRLRVAAEDAAARILKTLHFASTSDIPPR